MSRVFLVAICTALIPWAASAQQVETADGRRAAQQPTSARDSSATAPRGRFLVRADGVYEASSRRFSDTLRLTRNLEEARYENRYRLRTGPSFAAGVNVAAWRRLELGAGVQRFSRSTPVDIEASVPHPFFFEQPRTFSGTAGGASRDELAVHVHIGTSFPLGERIVLRAFGGPTVFQVRQGVVTDVEAAEEYPYDTATFRSATIREAKGTRTGGHAGGDLAYFFTRRVGIGGTVMFSAGSIPVDVSGSRISVDAGGLSGGAGLRLRF